ncbi:MAG: valine--tRNA ligase [bacterium]|nr:valine--tRNA ligase [Acidimicrobiia bacterium]MCY4650413.1 valine--tRNA ligase [bacterium]
MATSTDRMRSAYDPAEIEPRWYSRWEQAGVFKPEYRPAGEPFCVVIPPPNVTGSLHMGHALNHTIHDVIARRRRMQGYAVLWLPGTDHAGIATQNVVEKFLADKGLNRFDLGREAFIDQVWEWKDVYGWRITQQIRRMGNSCDWTRERFTFDEGLSKAVLEVFVRLYEDGLIYRGKRIINWCPRCETALAEIEVEHQPEDGELVHIAYPFTDGSAAVTVATTRAETMLGDTGVAVHPDDERYRDMVGRTVRLPLVGRVVPVVADSGVDPEFGTGAVKVTPAHDPLDFEIGERHGLESVLVLDEQAVITEAGGRFQGLDRFEARQAVIVALAEEGVLVGREAYRHSVGLCYRCDTVVEPLLSTQWFVKVEELARPAIEAVRSADNRFIPAHWEKSYFHWMENLRDWCISRQIWWGHRIPAWYCFCGHVTVARAYPGVCGDCGAGELNQDADVLDTWFSSALWPFSTLGWPEETEDLARFYPNMVLITGFDIIYFWVARMMKMGLRFMGEVPFAETVIHGLVRDSNGQKMSKSLGNTIDPLVVAEEYGADPLRLALVQAANPGQDVPLDMEWVEGARKFGNKLWNAVRYALRHLPEGSVPPTGGYPNHPGPVDRWVLAALGEVTDRFDELSDGYRFSDAYGLLYNFAWAEVFDWYLEMSKAALAGSGTEDTRQTLGVVMRDLLRLFHPAIPFLTEELWSHLVGEGLLAGADWPEVPAYDPVPEMEDVKGLISGIRQFRAAQGLSYRQTLSLGVTGSPHRWVTDLVEKMAGVEIHRWTEATTAGHAPVAGGRWEGFISLRGLVDPHAEGQRIDRAIARLQVQMSRSSSKLDNPNFVQRAPEAVVEKERQRLAEATDRLVSLQRQREAL